jgi:hypothetical protein
VSQCRPPTQVRLVVSLRKSCDTDLFLAPPDAVALAGALGGLETQAVKARTADDHGAVVVTEGDRLAITVPSDRLSDVLLLGPRSKKLQEALTAAASIGQRKDDEQARATRDHRKTAELGSLNGEWWR